jgi:hypothetical protein
MDSTAKNYLSKRQKYDILETELRQDRESFRNAWRDLSTYILPRRSRFFVSDVNRADRRNLEILDSTATLASRTLSSGMMTGITSPARAWFNLGTDQDELSQSDSVKSYLSEVTKKMRGAFLRSNLYNVLPVLYEDLGTYGTGCIFMEADSEDTFHFTHFPIGSYMLANDHKKRARVFIREFQMSVRQIVDKFGRLNENDPTDIDWSNISLAVKNLYESGQLEAFYSVNHVVKPNDEYDNKKMDSKYKKFSSVYYENGAGDNTTRGAQSMPYMGSDPEKFLSEKGYDYYPIMAARWSLIGEDTYGTGSPGFVGIGDVKQLQLAEKRILSALDQKVRPAMVGPTSLKNQKASILPGDITYIDGVEGAQEFRPVFNVNFDIREIENKQDQLRQRISRVYYEDLFLMLANTNRKQITAREIDERHEEKLLALGPVLERVNQDLLDPLIDNAFAIMEAAGQLPELPEELAGTEYKIEYISIMAQAQRLAGIGNIERLMGFVGQMGQYDPEAIAKVNIEETIELYGDLVGAPHELLKTKAEMEELREQRAAAQQQQAQKEEQGQLLAASKTLSETKMDEDSALSQLTGGSGV